jgi:hypothetical protein
MDYKEKYLKLKQYVMDSNQRGSGKMNPLLVNNLSNLAFVVDDKILNDDAHAVILSLIDEFNKIAALDLKHNPEISQYYSVGNGLSDRNGSIICENCEIVLKYADATVCVTNSKMRQNASEDKGNKSEIDCNISRGLIRFYIKQREGNSYKYKKINVVNVQRLNSLQPYLKSIYQNNDEIKRLEEAGNIALTQGQADAIYSTSKTGQLDINNPEEFQNTTRTVNDIITESKNAIVQSQLNKMNNQRILSLVPTQNSVNAANTVANTIMKTNTAKISNLTTVMIPNNEPIPLSVDNNVKPVPANITNEGISVKTVGGTNTMNSRVISNRSSIEVDANLAVVPTENVATDQNINVAPSTKSLSSVSNELVKTSKDLYNKTGDLVGDVLDKTNQTFSDLTNKVKNLFSNKSDLSQSMVSKATVVPVSQNMSVMTSLPKDKAIVDVPVPQNNNNVISQKNISNRFENKIGKTNQSVTVNQSNRASAISRNGDVSIKRTQDVLAQPQNNKTSEASTSNRTVAKPKQPNYMVQMSDTSEPYNSNAMQNIGSLSETSISSAKTFLDQNYQKTKLNVVDNSEYNRRSKNIF